MKYFIKALFVALLFINPVFADDGETGTNFEFDWFDWTIYPEDKSVGLVFDLFPKTAEVSSDIIGLEYKEELIDAAKLRQESSVANYNVSGLEGVSVHISPLIRYLALFFILVHVLVAMYRWMSGNTQLAPELASKVKTLTFLAVAFTPIFGVTPAGALGVSLYFAGVGGYNALLSPLTYYMSSQIPDQGLYINNDHVVTSSRAAENIPLTRARQLIESAVCLNQSALAGIYSDADTKGLGARRSAIANGEHNDLSVLMDGTATLHEVEIKDSSAVIMSGWGLENAENPLICDTKSIKKPTPTTEIVEFLSIIDDEIKGLRSKTLTAELALDGWANIKSSIKGRSNSEEVINDTLTQAANYYFSSLMFYAENGGILDGDKGSYDSYNRQVSLADKIAKELRAKECFGERTAYINSKFTIEKLNRGYVGASSFDISCAVLDGGALKMAFEADSSNLSQFSSDSLELASNHPVAIRDSYEALLKTFAPHVAITNAYISALKKLRIDSVTGGKSVYQNEYLEFLVKMRKEGMIGFAFSFLPSVEMAGNVITDLSKHRFDASPINGSYVYISNYNAESGYLPPNADQSRYKSASILLPAFIFSTNGGVEGSDISKTIEANFESQINTNNGNTSSPDAVKSSGYEYAMVGLDADVKPQAVDSAELTNNIIYNIINPFVYENTYKENGLTITERKTRMLALCGKNEISGDDIAKLGGRDPMLDLVNYCAKYSSQPPLIYQKNEGLKLIESGATMAAVGLSGGAAAFLATKSLNKASKLKAKKPTVDGGISSSKKSQSTELKDVIPSKGGFVGEALKKMMEGMKSVISGIVLQSIAGMISTLLMFLGSFHLVMYYMIPFMLLSMIISYLIPIAVVAALPVVFGLLIAMGDKKINFSSNAVRSTGMRLTLYPICICLFAMLSIAATFLISFIEDIMGIGDVEAIANSFSSNFAISSLMIVVLMIVTKIAFVMLLANVFKLIFSNIEGFIESVAGDRSRDEGADTAIAEGAMYMGAQTSSMIIQNLMNRAGNAFKKTSETSEAVEAGDDLKAGAGATSSAQTSERGRLREHVSTQSNTSTNNQVSQTEKPKSDINDEADKPNQVEEIEGQALESPENKTDDADRVVNEESEPPKQDK
ncbi:hypothetical protein NPN16_22345 [Vibrio parahaemolyticus]|uniref:hypothetical protein n=2 Tax=Vibrio parahaemolyticus TaxID=670 RepID=UPI0021132B53|nr:hypothetical protein [Vibrio parahaemolyticus]MCQ4503030.1 hypothetical protein [Vibrio parahaemolyticus]MCQ6458167.1 hypothetical protein [Vibrio parahaemolyticus]MCQ6463149.1 hypothetical protein [Vibrio parahaemolyticus]MCQ6467996.1 hypothetical protein [Vibrio parahaemolyticus]MCQ6473072.1 hypothetical protein [Vibrio parahaemolyticus]